MEINYVGENLLPGYLGYFFVALAFGMSVLALAAYVFHSTNPKEYSWRTIARWAFVIHSIAILGIIGSMFHLIYAHSFEYLYVWQHSSKELPVHYMISCFWEGQEGSFLLWAFWHFLIGLVLIGIGDRWEGPVMAVLCLAQVTLTSMLLGFDLGAFSIGSNPFMLLRDAFPNEELFRLQNYVPLIEDGTGLNPLLQNYWMVIHPPVIFVGYAAMIVPFGYAIAGLWYRSYKEWIAPALPWALFSVMTLGAGILMGGAWAYETLNFGGFWAWDPVENASLVPWLLMIAAVHTMIVFKNSGNAVVSSFVLITLSFISVLYATFLTRSGVLGDASVHSFTDLGLSTQLMMFMFIFLGLSIFMMIWRRKELPVSQKEEELYSREFWMFIGALVLSISSLQIIFSTSIPVFNNIPGLNIAPPADPIQHYNRFQLPFAIIIGFLAGAGQYFRYKNTAVSKFIRQFIIITLVTIVLTVLFTWVTGMYNIVYNLLLFSCIFAVVGNLPFLSTLFRKGKGKFSGAAISHIGFGILLIGALVSKSQQEVVSINYMGVDFGGSFDEQQLRENILLIKDRPYQMGDYIVTYRGDSSRGPNIYYQIDYQRLNPTSGEVVETFSLFPNSQINPDMGLVSSPDTRHYLTKDLYTHISSVPDKESGDFDPEYIDPPDTLNVKIGDTISNSPFMVVVEGIRKLESHDRINIDQFDLVFGLDLRVHRHNRDRTYLATPAWGIDGNQITHISDELPDHALRFKLVSVDTENEAFTIEFHKGEGISDYVVMKAISFPYINLLWIGIIILVIGFSVAMFHRIGEYKRKGWKTRW